MAEIGDEAIGYVAHRVGDSGQPRSELDARLGQLESRDQRGPLLRRKLRIAAAQGRETEKRVADRAGDPDTVA